MLFSISPKSRILFVQYGDYKDAIRNFADGGNETYYAQKYSVDWVAKLGGQIEAVFVLCLNKAYADWRTPSGVLAGGMKYWHNGKENRHLLYKKANDFRPTHIILLTPLTSMLQWGIQKQIALLPIFADSFYASGPFWKVFKKRIVNKKLVKLLNSNAVQWVGNHNIPASISLRSIGVNPGKIIPWDWPDHTDINRYVPKILEHKDHCTLFFVGAVSEAKGVGDLIRAVSLLKEMQPQKKYFLTIAGKGNIKDMCKIAEQVNVTKEVKFIGCVDNSQIISLMHEHDAVLVPSRKSYSEGLPLTIYESFVSKSPLISSTHPMFTSLLNDRQESLFFKEGNPHDLADKIALLFSDSNLYQQLSENSLDSYSKISCKTKWADFLMAWLAGLPENIEWLSGRTLEKVTNHFGNSANT